MPEWSALVSRRSSAPPSDLIGNRYRLEQLIGRGGVADVYRAEDTRLRRLVAVKMLRESPTSDSRRFDAEAAVLARIDHPNLVRLLDSGSVDGQHYLVTDLIEGRSLASRLSDGPLTAADTSRIGAATASALQYVHDRGIVHRDIKPGNILLGRRGEVRLADFGIARLTDTTGLTVTGMALGTPAYLAPEQVDGASVGPPADIYALGLVLLECLTGRRAYEGTASEAAVARLQRGPVIVDGLHPAWRVLIRSMTALSPAARPPAREVQEFLSGPPSGRPPRPPAIERPESRDPAVITTQRIRIAGPPPTSQLRTPWSWTAPPPAAPPSQTGQHAPGRTRQRSRGRDWLIALAFALAALGLEAGYIIAEHYSPPIQQSPSSIGTPAAPTLSI